MREPALGVQRGQPPLLRHYDTGADAHPFWGADAPERIAVSIVAQLLAVRAARAPRHLRERESAIHAW